MIKSCNQFSNSSNTAEIVENESRGSLTPLPSNDYEKVVSFFDIICKLFLRK